MSARTDALASRTSSVVLEEKDPLASSQKMDEEVTDTQKMDSQDADVDVTGVRFLKDRLRLVRLENVPNQDTIQWAYAFYSTADIFNCITDMFILVEPNPPLIGVMDEKLTLIVETLPTYGNKDRRWIRCGIVRGQLLPEPKVSSTGKRLAYC